MKTSETTTKLFPAMAKAYAEVRPAAKDNTNPAFKSKYADLAGYVEVLQPVAAAHGLFTVQELTSDDSGVHVSTRICHISGQWLEVGPLFIPANKHDAQGFGSAASYARRYALSAAWNMVADDDDGNAAVKSTPKKAPASLVPDGYDDWLDNLRAYAASGVTKDDFRATYGKSKPEHRKYLETNNRPTLDAMLAKVTKAAA